MTTRTDWINFAKVERDKIKSELGATASAVEVRKLLSERWAEHKKSFSPTTQPRFKAKPNPNPKPKTAYQEFIREKRNEAKALVDANEAMGSVTSALRVMWDTLMAGPITPEKQRWMQLNHERNEKIYRWQMENIQRPREKPSPEPSEGGSTSEAATPPTPSVTPPAEDDPIKTFWDTIIHPFYSYEDYALVHDSFKLFWKYVQENSKEPMVRIDLLEIAYDFWNKQSYSRYNLDDKNEPASDESEAEDN